MLLLVLSLKLLNFITFLLFSNLSTGRKLMREFNTKFSLSLTYKTLSSAPSAFNSEYCPAAPSVSLSVLAPVLFSLLDPVA